ncbi:hypothetical protein KEM52_006330 [Ascosphaera acerosa]|nr:hypothetical protein KEM52_006330 [Ascosphaera acerosa]
MRLSVSLPTWDATVGYEEGKDWVVQKMSMGYPRFFIHPSIRALEQAILARFVATGNGDAAPGAGTQASAMLFPSRKGAAVCCDFMLSRLADTEEQSQIRTLELQTRESDASVLSSASPLASECFAVIFPSGYYPLAKQVWQHGGEGISSRRAEFLLGALQDGRLDLRESQPGATPAENIVNGQRSNGTQVLDERMTRRNGCSEVHTGIQIRKPGISNEVKIQLRQRLAEAFNHAREAGLSPISDSIGSSRVTAGDVFLFPTGMSAIFNTHQLLLNTMDEGHTKKSVCFGFPYVDTYKILQKWGPGAVFYGRAAPEELDELEVLLRSGSERILALFTEFPNNPLLGSPDLQRIRALADEYHFAVVIDDTIGTCINVDVLPLADVVVTSLTKTFSGSSDVMAGSAVLNPRSRFYARLKRVLTKSYEEGNLWSEDALVLERNSRDFAERVTTVNRRTEAAVAFLKQSPLGMLFPLLTLSSYTHTAANYEVVKEIYYPLYSPSKSCFDRHKNVNGGYGGLFSVVFHELERAKAFFDTLDVMKGPSLGTNFTLW